MGENLSGYSDDEEGIDADASPSETIRRSRDSFLEGWIETKGYACEVQEEGQTHYP